MPLSLSLLKLYVIPILRQAGSEGGTAVVNRSKNLSMISLVVNSPSFIKNFSEIAKPTIVMIPMMIIYFTESLVKVSLSFLGYKIPPIKFPLKVLKPVL